MSSTRTTAEQGKTCTLKINIKKNGVLKDPYDIGTVSIIDSGSTAQQTGVVPTKLSDGVWSIDYAISPTAVTGTWTDRWTDVIYDSGLSPVNIDLNFYVNAADWEGTTPSVCDVSIFCFEQDGDPRVNIEGTSKIVNAPYEYGDGFYSANYEGTSTSDSSGKMVFSLVYGAVVLIKIPDLKIENTILVPSLATAQLKDIEEVT